jgi:hypothetical protein
MVAVVCDVFSTAHAESVWDARATGSVVVLRHS